MGRTQGFGDRSRIVFQSALATSVSFIEQIISPVLSFRSFICKLDLITFKLKIKRVDISERIYKVQMLQVWVTIWLSNHGRFFIDVLGQVKGYVYLLMLR